MLLRPQLCGGIDIVNSEGFLFRLWLSSLHPIFLTSEIGPFPERTGIRRGGNGRGDRRK